MAEFAVPLMLAGTAISAISAIQQGEAAKQAADFNAAVARRNASIATQQANADADAQQRQARAQIGKGIALYGASGVTPEGSPIDVLTASAEASERDRQNIIYKGQLRAMGFTDEANLDTYSGEMAQQRGYMSAAGILLSGAGKAAYMGGLPGGGSSGGGSADIGWYSGRGIAPGADVTGVGAAPY